METTTWKAATSGVNKPLSSILNDIDPSAAANRLIRRIFVRRRKSAEKIRRQPSSAEF